jgi:hypothetical protein
MAKRVRCVMVMVRSRGRLTLCELRRTRSGVKQQGRHDAARSSRRRQGMAAMAPMAAMAAMVPMSPIAASTAKQHCWKQQRRQPQALRRTPFGTVEIFLVVGELIPGAVNSVVAGSHQDTNPSHASLLEFHVDPVYGNIYI